MSAVTWRGQGGQNQSAQNRYHVARRKSKRGWWGGGGGKVLKYVNLTGGTKGGETRMSVK